MAENGFYHTDYTLPLMFLADGSDSNRLNARPAMVVFARSGYKLQLD